MLNDDPQESHAYTWLPKKFYVLYLTTKGTTPYLLTMQKKVMAMSLTPTILKIQEYFKMHNLSFKQSMSIKYIYLYVYI